MRDNPNRDIARQAIKTHSVDIAERLLQKAKVKVNGKSSYICPFCGHGKNGDGLAQIPNSYTFKCFGCEYSGDIIDLYGQINDLTHNEALTALSDILNIDLQGAEHTPTSPKQTTEGLKGANIPQESDTPLNDDDRADIIDYTAFYKSCAEAFNNSLLTKRYLIDKRGISEDIAKKYMVGYSPAWQSPKALREGKNPPTSKRIIIPVAKNCYIARAIESSDIPKMNETGNGKMNIFNIKALYDNDMDYCFVTEGAIDALSIMTAGAYAIATNSTSNIDMLIKRLTTEPVNTHFIASFDNDDAGIKATNTFILKAQEAGVKCSSFNICGAFKDANEALTADKERFTKKIQEAIEQAKMIEKDKDNKAVQTQDNPEMIEKCKSDIEKFWENINSEKYKYISTGLSWLDKVLGGGIVKKRILMLLAAPSTGKTTLLQNIAENMAKQGHDFIYFSFEMSTDAMLSKAISRYLALKNDEKLLFTSEQIMQTFNRTDEEKAEIKKAIDAYSENIAPHLSYVTDLTASNQALSEYLHDKACKAKAEGKDAPAIVIDYLHLLSDEKITDQKEILKESIRIIREYVDKYNTFAFVISATGRESNKGGAVTMESARDSSNIEYGADYILTLNYNYLDKDGRTKDREEMSKEKSKRLRDLLLYLDKNRFGASGTKAEVLFNAENNTFYDKYGFVPAYLKSNDNIDKNYAEYRKKRR